MSETFIWDEKKYCCEEWVIYVYMAWEVQESNRRMQEIEILEWLDLVEELILIRMRKLLVILSKQETKRWSERMVWKSIRGWDHWIYLVCEINVLERWRDQNLEE